MRLKVAIVSINCTTSQKNDMNKYNHEYKIQNVLLVENAHVQHASKCFKYTNLLNALSASALNVLRCVNCSNNR